jgi:hypothetical protein
VHQSIQGFHTLLRLPNEALGQEVNEVGVLTFQDLLQVLTAGLSYLPP